MLRDQQQLPAALAVTCPAGWGLPALMADLALDLLETSSAQPITELAHPDFRWLEADGPEIKIDQVRRLVEFAVQTPQLAPRKVAVLLDAHLLNRAAANALLKTLEEPPPNTHLLLATGHWGKVMPTVRSRCQRYAVPADAARAADWLQQQGVQAGTMDLALAGFAPLQLRDELVEAGHVSFAEGLDKWLAGVPRKPLPTAVDELLAGDVGQFLARWYRRLSLALQDKDIDGLALDARGVHQFADLLLNTRRQIETLNSANDRLLCEALLVEWVRLCRR
ncbi:MAG: hypothetical protein AAF993_07350 [Pseudomonadota bacterium]